MTVDATPHLSDVCLAVVRSAASTARLLVRGALTTPRALVGTVLRDADGGGSTVFRETRAARRAADRVLLVVAFRLRWVGNRRWAHAVFRTTCVVNTPLFAGFPGFVSKLWLTDRSTGVYRGLYEWDGASAAKAYVLRLAQVLRLVTVPGSVSYAVVEGVDRAEVLADRIQLPAPSLR
ncbi:MAG: hypothetical protein J0I34_18420 [Pseudonocardia sp.]|uniref:hypothetical protein n=1 Tax=unclassified Pseudonocardia TaxID=2619320 RepID=UPI000AF2E150|nr:MULTISPECIES: hypothetical protein [unclassified Pseudonocardia]MBN9110741.1 hypothetical protein [Pseudonocardia sp.]